MNNFLQTIHSENELYKIIGGIGFKEALKEYPNLLRNLDKIDMNILQEPDNMLLRDLFLYKINILKHFVHSTHLSDNSKRMTLIEIKTLYGAVAQMSCYKREQIINKISEVETQISSLSVAEIP